MDIQAKIARVIKNFAWWNYGLDIVSEAESDEWVADLTEEIIQALQEYLRIP